MTAVDPPEDVRVGGDVHFPADLRPRVKGERDPESLRAILWAFLTEQVRDDPLALIVLIAVVVGGVGLIGFTIGSLT